jgi:hypothetical protein
MEAMAGIFTSGVGSWLGAAKPRKPKESSANTGGGRVATAGKMECGLTAA